jgi:hypothetical protein
MARKRKHYKKSKVERKQPGKVIKAIFSLLMTVLGAAVLVLTLRIGDALWSRWLVEHRTPIIGLLLLAIIILAIATPIIVEVEKDPRPLSGSDVDSKWLI